MTGRIKLTDAQKQIAQKYNPNVEAQTVSRPNWSDTYQKQQEQKSVSAYEKRQSELAEQRRQAQVDLDIDTINRIDAELKTLRANAGKQTTADRVGDVVGASASGTVGNVANAAGTLLDLLNGSVQSKAVNNLYNFADTAAKDTKRFTQDAKQGLGKVGQFAVDAGIAGGQLATDMAASALIPGAGLALVGARGFGGGAQEARQAGATLGQQAAYGAGTAAVSVLSEKLFNVAGPYAKTFGKGFFDKVASKLTGSAAGRVIASALTEGAEEGLESVLQPVLKNLTYTDGEKVDWSEAAYEALIGAVLGGLVGAADVSVSQSSRIAAKESPATVPAASEGSNAPKIKTPQNGPESDSGVVLEIAEKQPFVPAVENTSIEKQDGLGAANAGSLNSDFQNLQMQSNEFYPEGANAARIPDVPKKDFEGKVISRFASNVIGAKGVSDETVLTVEQLVADGVLSDDVLHNKTALANAEKEINRLGSVEAAMERLRQAAAHGETSPELIAMMEALLIDSEASSTRNEARSAELVVIGSQLSRSAARSTQLLSYLRKMSPTYQIQAIENVVKSAEDANKSGKQRIKELVSNAETEAIEASIEQKDVAIGVIQALIDSYAAEYGKDVKTLADVVDNISDSNVKNYLKGIDQYIAKEKDSGWVQTLGRELAAKAANRAKDKPTKQRTIYETIASDLNAFMSEHVAAKKGNAPKRTAADRIADFFNNRSEYARAWTVAKEQLKSKYSGNQVMLDRLEEFFDSPIGYNGEGPDTVMLRAVTEATLANDLKIKNLSIRNQYDANALVEQIASTLIRQTNAKGSDQTIIRDAVRRHVNEKVLDANKDNSKYIESDVRKVLKDAGLKISEVMKTGAENKAALAKRISDVLVSQYGISVNGANAISADIVKQFNSMMEASAEAYLKARFGDKVPKEAKSFGQRLSELANMGAFTNPNYRESASASLIGEEAAKSVSNTPEWKALTDKFKSAKTDGERNAVVSEMQQFVADNITKTFGNKLADWVAAIRYMNMLGNFRTPLRNVLGNIANRALYEADNALIAAAERLSGNKLNNTRAVFVGRALKNAAKADADVVASQLLEGGGKYADARNPISKNAFMRGVAEKSTVFGNIFGIKNPLEIGRKTVDWMMNNKYFGDEAFLKNGYARFLGGYLQANGVTAEQWSNPEWQKANSGLVNAARDNAIRLAKEAAFRQDNAFSAWVSKIGRRPDTPWYIRTAVEGTMPFRKTPANVAVAIAEHSPAGIANAVIKAVQKAKGDVGADGNPKATGTDILESVAKSVSGSALLGLGIYLAKAGLLRGAQDEDDKQAAFDNLLGHQDYAIELEDGTSFTIDWLAPAATPVIMGAELYRRLQNEGFGIETVLGALTSISDPMLEMSFVSSMQDAIEEVRYSEDGLEQIVLSAMLNYLTQIMTSTIGGQLERTTQEESMMTYVDKNSNVPQFVQEALGKTSAKIPGWDYAQIPYIDAWGRTESTGDPLERAANNLFNPAYMSEVNVDNVEKELQRVYDAVGAEYGSVFPDRADKSFEINGKPKNLTAEQYVKYAKAKGQNSYKFVQQVINSPAYKEMRDSEKAELIADMYAYANYTAKKAVVPTYKNDTYDKYAEAEKQGITPAEYAAYRFATNDMEADKDKDGKSISGSKEEKVVDYINGLNMTPTEKDWLYLLNYKSDNDRTNLKNLRQLPWNR